MIHSIQFRWHIAILPGIIALGLGGCASAPSTRLPSPMASPSATVASPSPTFPAQRPSGSPSPPPAPAPQSGTIMIYTIDDQCLDLVPQPLEAERLKTGDRPVDGAIQQVIEVALGADFDLAGYRMSINQEGVATLDLRVAPNAKRQLASLSTCEQLALFGGLRKTLTDHQGWGIRAVRFTEQGKEIVL